MDNNNVAESLDRKPIQLVIPRLWSIRVNRSDPLAHMAFALRSIIKCRPTDYMLIKQTQIPLSVVFFGEQVVRFLQVPNRRFLGG